MSDDTVDPSNKDPQISSADNLTKTTKSDDVEMTEEELKRVSGGTPPKSDKPSESLSLNFAKIQIIIFDCMGGGTLRTKCPPNPRRIMTTQLDQIRKMPSPRFPRTS